MTYCFSVSNGLLSAEHKREMGAAVWYFLLLVDWQTSPEGEVLGGAPITLKRLASQFGESEGTARRALTTLENGGYIDKKRSQCGYVIRISNPKKRFRPSNSDTPDLPELVGLTI